MKEVNSLNSNIMLKQIKVLEPEQSKILQTSILPYKITKELKGLLEKIYKREAICMKVVPNSIALRGIKDTFKHSIAMNSLLLMMCKVKLLKMELSHSKLSKKLSIQQSSLPTSQQGQEEQKNWKFIAYLTQHFGVRNRRQSKLQNQYQFEQLYDGFQKIKKIMSKDTITFQSLLIEFKDQQDTSHQSYSINFAIKFFENLCKIQPFDQIQDAKFINCYPLASDYIFSEQRMELLTKLCQTVSKFIMNVTIQNLTLQLENQNMIFKQIGSQSDNLVCLFTIKIEQRACLNASYLFEFLKKTPNLCNIKISAERIGQEDEDPIKYLIEEFLPQYCPMIEAVLFVKQKLPNLNAQKLGKILYRCPFLGELLFQAPTSYQHGKNQKVQQILDLMRWRRITLRKYMKLLKKIDLEEGYSYDNCLSILDCYQQIAF